MEKIDEFRRFAATYLMWFNANADRIVNEAIRRALSAESQSDANKGGV